MPVAWRVGLATLWQSMVYVLVMGMELLAAPFEDDDEERDAMEVRNRALMKARLEQIAERKRQIDKMLG